MLRAISPDTSAHPVTKLVPAIVRPLQEACATRQPLAPVLQATIRELEFDHFMYGVTSVPHPTRETRTFTWTSLPDEWVRLYNERAYIEVDPRLAKAWEAPMPYIWDRESCAKTQEQHAFFDAAKTFGIGSGIAVALRNRFDAPGVFVLSAAAPANDIARHQHIGSILGQVLVLAAFVHDLLLTSYSEHGWPSSTTCKALTARERQCLQLAAQGLSSREIGATLNIGERTVHSHFSSLLAKLGAANRHEAIAKASAVGLIAA